MSAVNPSSGDREVEALRRAQRAHEPSMEEILASIRNIIIDERDAEKAAPSRPASPRAAAPAPQIVYSKEDPTPQRAPQDTALRAEPPAAPDVKPAPEIKPAAEAKPSPEARPAPAKPPMEASAAKEARRQTERASKELSELPSRLDEEPLLSPEAGETVTSAFEAFSAHLAARGAEIAQGMAREMLRPMLKAWLDENLPGIVERLVRAEIERVARGMR
ncbi:MAG TPA: DUF2497 domain-containing protein [Roseiarcus sp.]|nr:DUF2497 domain-containing protein [Roseiarcus sp.]